MNRGREEPLPHASETPIGSPDRTTGRYQLAVCIPCFVAGLLLVLHSFVPDREPASPIRIYFDMLVVFEIATLILAFLALFVGWPRAWLRRNAPLIAGGIAMLGLWDFVTLKMAWMPLPYFP